VNQLVFGIFQEIQVSCFQIVSMQSISCSSNVWLQIRKENDDMQAALRGGEADARQSDSQQNERTNHSKI
jgi:hypothetical protein